MTYNIAVIVGSLRKDSYNAHLAKALVQLAPKDFAFVFPDIGALSAPKTALTRIISPVQNAFNAVTNSVVDYLRKLKIRGEIEYEYDELLKLLDEYADKAALADEYQKQIDELYDQIDEMDRNPQLDPITATVIGHDTANYFSVLTIDVGKNRGIADYMAVVKGGGLVGNVGAFVGAHHGEQFSGQVAPQARVERGLPQTAGVQHGKA